MAILAGAAWAHRTVIDDGFIYLRIVHQVTAGHGPVFNTGQRVEAFTGPVWLAVLSVVDLLTPLRLEWAAVLIGIASTLAGLTLAISASARLARRGRDDRPGTLLVPFGAAVVVVLLPMWFYASSGLETGITFLWLGACLWIMTRWAASGKQPTTPDAMVLGLGWLVRPELVLYSIAFLLVVVLVGWRDGSLRKHARVLAAAIALPLAYQVFRMGYFGALTPNTAIAKEGSRLRWQRGWRYFRDFADTYWFAVPAAALLVGGYAPLGNMLRRAHHKRELWVSAAFLVAGAVNLLYIIGVGGDYEHARLLLPAVFAICAPVAVVSATTRHIAAVALAPWAIAAAFVLRPATNGAGAGFAIPRAGSVTTDDSHWGRHDPNVTSVSDDGLYVQQGISSAFIFKRSDLPLLPSVRQPVAASLAIGVSSYAVGNRLNVLDMLGLADPLTARLQTPLLTSRLPYPGHEKRLPRPWIAARLFPPGTDVQAHDLPPDGGFFVLIPTLTGTALEQQTAWARSAMQCPALQRLNRSVTAHLSVSRFLHNVVDSFANTSLRVPPDPHTAYIKLCPASTTGRAVPARADHIRSAVFGRETGSSAEPMGAFQANRRRVGPDKRVAVQHQLFSSGFI